MADALYLLTLKITEQVADILNPEIHGWISDACFFICIFYAPWFLKCSKMEHASNNDILCFKQVFILEKYYPALAGRLLESLMLHTWYLTRELVVTCVADDAVKKEDKQEILIELLKAENMPPDVFEKGKPKLPDITPETKLSDLVGPQSWQILQVAGVGRSDIEAWAETGEVNSSFVKFVRQLTCVNDCSERNIRLVQEYCATFHSEDMRQNAFQVARDNRQKLGHGFTKSDLKEYKTKAS